MRLTAHVGTDALPGQDAHIRAIGTLVAENTPLMCLRVRLSSPCAGR
ncbi:hypothetical protein ABID80_004250 [Streptomyces sp. PvP037]